MSFIDWLDEKNERLVFEHEDVTGQKIEFSGLVKDEEVKKSFYINEDVEDGYVLRNTKKETKNTKYWVFSENTRTITTQKTGKVVLEDVENFVLNP